MTPQKEKLVSNWCQNRKNHNFKRNKILQTIDFKGFAKKKSQKISTHLLTVLIVNVIVQLEQRKRDKKKELLRNPESWMFQITTHQIFQTNISYVLNNIYKVLEGDMTYDDA